MQSKAKTVKEYLAQLPEDRRKAMGAVRKTMLKNLPKGYEEVMQYGMMGYVVPLKLYPRGYLGDKKTPIPYVGLASQKNYMSVYLTNIYVNKKSGAWFKKAYKASPLGRAGKKLDMGKGCIRFRKLEDLPLELIGQAVALTSVKEMIATHESSSKHKRTL